MKKTKLTKLGTFIKVPNMKQFCEKNSLSVDSYYSKKKRAKADKQKYFVWEKYLFKV